MLALLALALTIGPATCIFVEGVRRGIPNPPVVRDNESTDPDVASARSGRIIADGLMKGCMAVGSVLWFAAAPKWLREDG
jgi:hypothetical protein